MNAEINDTKDESIAENACQESLWVVCVLLSQQLSGKLMRTQTISWRGGVSEDEAVGAAIKYAMETRPGYAVEMFTAVDIGRASSV